jgi:hypothetical protein
LHFIWQCHERPVNMKKASVLVLGLAVILTLCSCITKSSVTANRYLPTGIGSQESMVVLLNSYSDDNETKSSESTEKEFENCLTQAMSAETPKLNSISAKDFRKDLFPGRSFEDAPRSPEAILSFFGNEARRKQAAKLGIRYLVVVDIITGDLDKSTEFQGQGVLIKWHRCSTFKAVILDMDNNLKSGDVHAAAWGDRGFGCTLPFPVVPFPFFTRTESEACSIMGIAIHKFVMGREELK